MELSNIKQTKESGFTLVELAIVMIIIGLLIGGILKGQELIANSQLTATVAQIKGIDAATSTFRDKYSALPGDMLTPTNRLANCAGPCAAVFATAGNGRIDGVAPGAAVAANETTAVFAHLAAADLISGVNGNVAGLTYGQELPEAKVGGGFNGIAYTAAALTTAQNARAGHYLVLSGSTVAVANDTGTVSPARAAQIDRKLDDGLPNAGGVRTDNQCASGTTNVDTYLEANDAFACSMYIRVQG